MKRVLKQKDIVDELNARTGFLKKNLYEIMDTLEAILLENMEEAAPDERSEVHLTRGFVFGGRYAPKRNAIDPRDGSPIVTPAKIIPYAKFTPWFRKKINNK